MRNRSGSGHLESIAMNYRLSDMFAVNFRAWRSYLRALVIVELIFVAVILVPLLLDGRSFRDVVRFADWWFPLLMSLVMLVLWFGLCPFISYWRTKRLGALGPNRFWFEEKGIKVQTPRIDSLVYWSALKRISVSKERLFLFVTPGAALIIPRRAVPSDHEFEAWAKRAKSMWSAAKAANNSQVE